MASRFAGHELQHFKVSEQHVFHAATASLPHRMVKAFEESAAIFSQQLGETSINITIPNQVIFAAENASINVCG